MDSLTTYEGDLNLKATELRLGLPGIDSDDARSVITSSARHNKRTLDDRSNECNSKTNDDEESDGEATPISKSQVVGWPPIQSFRRNSIQARKAEAEAVGMYVKVSMDGAPYLRKIDLKGYKGYRDLLMALEEMFKCFKIREFSEGHSYNGHEYVPTYEDKDGDWMLVGDVPWEMFISSCKRMRIMKGTEARGLGSNL